MSTQEYKKVTGSYPTLLKIEAETFQFEFFVDEMPISPFDWDLTGEYFLPEPTRSGGYGFSKYTNAKVKESSWAGFMASFFVTTENEDGDDVETHIGEDNGIWIELTTYYDYRNECVNKIVPCLHEFKGLTEIPKTSKAPKVDDDYEVDYSAPNGYVYISTEKLKYFDNLEQLLSAIKTECQEISDYFQGEVYGIAIEDYLQGEDGENLVWACSGFYGDYRTSGMFSYVEEVFPNYLETIKEALLLEL